MTLKKIQAFTELSTYIHDYSSTENVLPYNFIKIFFILQDPGSNVTSVKSSSPYTAQYVAFQEHSADTCYYRTDYICLSFSRYKLLESKTYVYLHLHLQHDASFILRIWHVEWLHTVKNIYKLNWEHRHAYHKMNWLSEGEWADYVTFKEVI